MADNDGRISPQHLPDEVRARISAMLAPAERALFDTGIVPNDAAVHLRQSAGSGILGDGPGQSYRAEVVTNGMCVIADYHVDGDTVKEFTEAYDLRAMQSIEIRDDAAMFMFPATDDEGFAQIGFSAETARAAIAFRYPPT
jgi:hypothetical protein